MSLYYIYLVAMGIIRDLYYFLMPILLAGLIHISFGEFWLSFFTWLGIFILYYGIEVTNIELRDKKKRLYKLSYLVSSLIVAILVFIYLYAKLNLTISIGSLSINLMVISIAVVTIAFLALKFFLEDSVRERIKREIHE